VSASPTESDVYDYQLFFVYDAEVSDADVSDSMNSYFTDNVSGFQHK